VKKNDVSTQFHHVFWCGDLNYRIESTREDVIRVVNENKLEELHDLDQLNNERKSGRVFANFTEGPISFTPTYKFDNNQPHTYYSESKNRVPAWCDRLLWSSWAGSESGSFVELIEYNTSHEVITSDHSPVYGVFNVKIEKPWLPAHFIDGECTIVLYNMHGENLRSCDSNGFSDPFLRVSAPFLLRGEETSVIKKNLNPHWEGEIIILIPLVPSIEYLQCKHIAIEARDQDIVGNDLIGRGAFSLFGVLDGFEHEFESTIWKHGTFSGRIKGNISIFFHDEE